MKSYSIPEELFKKIVAYLASRPYAEVADGLNQLLAIQPVGPRSEPAKE